MECSGEAQVLSRYCKSATLVYLSGLHYPFFFSDPWSAALEGKKVLVISPFVDSIRRQHDRYETLWDDPRVLPQFELLTVRVPMSAGLVEPVDADWTSALARLKDEMSQLDYDVALVGAGAFSLPLVVHAKQRGESGFILAVRCKSCLESWAGAGPGTRTSNNSSRTPGSDRAKRKPPRPQDSLRADAIGRRYRSVPR